MQTEYIHLNYCVHCLHIVFLRSRFSHAPDRERAPCFTRTLFSLPKWNQMPVGHPSLSSDLFSFFCCIPFCREILIFLTRRNQETITQEYNDTNGRCYPRFLLLETGSETSRRADHETETCMKMDIGFRFHKGKRIIELINCGRRGRGTLAQVLVRYLEQQLAHLAGQWTPAHDLH